MDMNSFEADTKKKEIEKYQPVVVISVTPRHVVPTGKVELDVVYRTQIKDDFPTKVTIKKTAEAKDLLAKLGKIQAQG